MNKENPAPSRTYPDLHDHLRSLESAGHLVRVDRAINKDTEMHPLVRWQFRGGFAEKDRKAFLFTNVVDSKGKHYDIPVVVGALAAFGLRADKDRHEYLLQSVAELRKVTWPSWNDTSTSVRRT